ncbi:serine hydrolase domain-containing protein [Erythrobacter crassostreae]|uniref:Beta-lactamase family protein n=1 Tax=Erythrobacter crassostreae TaxID=2828328 RepID=A0A9X1F4T5_9SPHN|nr:serine hydrolase domain-containing protein [Erythrobacter crassostrea]MBV7259864.1 beta-lactamase family protein [Erythrobacter crassostrea]
MTTRRKIGLSVFAVLALSIGALVLASIFEPSLDPDFEKNLTAATPDEMQSLIAKEAAKLGVTAVSITVIDGDQAPESHYVGRARADGLMQVASLSKAAAAASILIVADQKGVGLDDDIREQITSLDIAALEGGDRPVTLRQLLSHSTGASQSGYPGYARDASLPSTAEVINDPPRIFESQLAFDGEPGEFRYSGGGYTIAQLWAEDVTGKAFHKLAEEVLLKPLGMAESTFAQPIDEAAIAPLVIVGADAGFDPTEGVFSSLEDSWHVYPEQAAAGLWTTSRDYARFIAALMDAATGTENAIPTEVATAMVTPQAETKWEPGSFYGLGIVLTVDDAKNQTDVWHTGANAGYRSYFVARAVTTETARRVVVVSANTASSSYLNRAIGDALMAR